MADSCIPRQRFGSFCLNPLGKGALVQESVAMDDIDRKIVHALQIAPRAPWNLVGSAVGIDPVTAARRWQRLHDTGVAWISCYPVIRTGTDYFLAELSCAPGMSVDVAMTLARDKNVTSVNVKAGGHDVLAGVGTASPGESARYSLDRLAKVPGIRNIRTLPVAMVYAEASHWRLRALDREGEAKMAAATREAPEATASAAPLRDDDWEMVHCLADNPRMPLGEIAERLGISLSSARRRLGAVSAGRIRLRCELVKTQSGWPVYGTFFANCPADRLDATARALGKVPEVRGILSLIGPANLYLSLWLRSVVHMQEFESQLIVKVPHLSIADRSLVLRPVKWMGQLLDEHGRRTGSVPIDIRLDNPVKDNPVKS
jgi:DNA-binding Lrp family transcriptional regulator